MITLRLAQPADIEVVAALWTRSAQWLHDRGYDQWQYPVRRDNIARAVDSHACWLAELDTSPVATITLDERVNPAFWYPSDDPDDALYVHRMVVDDSVRGKELGSALLDWAGRQASAKQRRWLRLDAWRTNTHLHDYYLRRGFELVRLVDDRSGSGACFQRPARVQLKQGPTLVEAPSSDHPPTTVGVPGRIGQVASTEKVSLSLDVASLVLARRAAQIEGVSLSSWVSSLVRKHAWASQQPTLTPDEQARRDELDVENDERELTGWNDGHGHRAAG